jgi:hypothetical protein
VRLACIAALGGALLSTPVMAQTFTCPEAPSKSDIQRQISGRVEISLVKRFLGKLGLEIEGKDVTADSISRYPNADQLHKELLYFSVKCQAIMARTDWPENQKLIELAEFADKWNAKNFNVHTNNRPDRIIKPIPQEKDLTPVEATVVASQLMRVLLSGVPEYRSHGEYPDVTRELAVRNYISRVSIPLCTPEGVINSYNDLKKSVERTYADDESGPVSIAIAYVGEIKEIDLNPLSAQTQSGSGMLKTIERCRYFISSLDYMVSVFYDMPRISMSGTNIYIVDRNSGLIKAILPCPPSLCRWRG